MIVHIDCNSYFASCEVAERPHLANEPVVVSSSNENNGGIILALNGPAKQIGLKRGMPLFQVADRQGESEAETFLHQGKTVHCFEVDHAKYYRISSRIMQLVREQDIVADFVQYSVDEFFGSIPLDNVEELRFYIGKVKHLIEEKTHIPVSCGCSMSYTLAKVATHFAKRYEGYHGICILPAEKRETALRLLPIEEVWGLGRRLVPRLKAMGFPTALAFANMPADAIREAFNITTFHTWQELNGTPAIHLETKGQKQSITQSRTLPTTSHDLNFLLEKISSYTSAAAKNLREQNSSCKQVTVFLNTNYHRPDLPQYENQATIKLTEYEDTTAALIKAADEAFRKIYKPGYEIKRLGVTLEHIVDNDSMQMALFEDPQKEKKRRLQAALDQINDTFASEVVHPGSYTTPSRKNKGITIQ